MASTSTSTKPQPLSYAERAKRAGAGAAVPGVAASPVSSRSRSTTSNGASASSNAHGGTGTGSSSPDSSSRNVTPSSSVVLTRPGTPPPPADAEAAQSAPAPASSPAKSPSKPPPPNVWAARKEQMAQRVAATQPPATAPVHAPHQHQPQPHAENTTPSPSASASSVPPVSKVVSASRAMLNGVVNSVSHNHISPVPSVPPPTVPKDREDPFVVNMPHTGSHGSDVPTAPSSAPSHLDDVDSWPEMGKVASTQVGNGAVGQSAPESEKKEGSSGQQKKSEKTKWVPIPAAELQATADALSRSQSQSHSRSQSQHQNHHQYHRPHSRQPSHSRNTSRHNANRVLDSRVPSGEASLVHSRAESTAHSRAESAAHSLAGSVQSSPRFPPRGRRLPDEGAPLGSVSGVGTGVGPYSFSPANFGARIDSGRSGARADDAADAPHVQDQIQPHVQSQTQPPIQAQAQVQEHIPPVQPPYQPHVQSQAHPAYNSQSPVYYQPPPGAPYGGSPMRNMYPLPPNGGYSAPLPQHQHQSAQHQHQPSYAPYSPYSAPQHLPQQQPYAPYMYAHMPYGYYTPPGQGHERQQQQQQSISPYDAHAQHHNIFDPNLGMRQRNDNGIGADGEKRAPASPYLPPATLRTRPPPPGESTALAGYRDIVAVPVSPLLNASAAPTHPTAQRAGANVSAPEYTRAPSGATAAKVQAQAREPDMVFGSVGRPGGIKSPSPVSSPVLRPEPVTTSTLGLDVGWTCGLADAKDASHERRKTFTAFSIGVKPGEAGPSTVRVRVRGKGRSKKGAEGARTETAPGRVESATDSPADGAAAGTSGERSGDGGKSEARRQTDGTVDLDQARQDDGRRERESDGGSRGVEVKVIDLTDPETKWEFGTSTQPDADRSTSAVAREDASLGHDTGTSGEYHLEGPSHHISTDMPHVMQHPQPHLMSGYTPPLVPPPHHMGYAISQPPLQLSIPMHVPIHSPSPQPQLQPPQHQHPGIGPLPLAGVTSPLAMAPPQVGAPGPLSVGDEWEVRDFGYGFGPTSGSGYVPERMREERLERERDRDFGGYNPGRSRRSSNASGYGGYYEGRGGFERGGYGPGRRGRGGPNGYGGRGFFGSRGGYSNRGGQNGQRHQHPHSHQPPFVVNQPATQQQQTPTSEVANGYYSPSQTNSSYLQSPYGQYPQPLPAHQTQSPQQQQQTPQQPALPPMPMPVTMLSFPLDPTRYYLLGQLEYYFSLQNLAQDFFLRQQMNSRGWISIPLIASFNRVRQLTMDAQLVKDVLTLSSVMEVHGDYVRMSHGQWEHFILPGAPTSTVDEGQGVDDSQVGDEGEVDAEEDEEDDVVFVLGRDAGRSWTTERRQNQASPDVQT